MAPRKQRASIKELNEQALAGDTTTPPATDKPAPTPQDTPAPEEPSADHTPPTAEEPPATEEPAATTPEEGKFRGKRQKEEFVTLTIHLATDIWNEARGAYLLQHFSPGGADSMRNWTSDAIDTHLALGTNRGAATKDLQPGKEGAHSKVLSIRKSAIVQLDNALKEDMMQGIILNKSLWISQAIQLAIQKVKDDHPGQELPTPHPKQRLPYRAATID